MKRSTTIRWAAPLMLGASLALADAGGRELCLDGRFDLGARLQGMAPDEPGWVAQRWCVRSEDIGDRLQFSVAGPNNPDAAAGFELAYLGPETVRVIQRETPPDLEFAGADVADEAQRVRRLDPVRLAEECLRACAAVAGEPAWQWLPASGADAPLEVRIEQGRVRTARSRVAMPLRGTVEVAWDWTWSDDATAIAPHAFTLSFDGRPLFEGEVLARRLEAKALASYWQPSGDQAPRAVPGAAWPSRVAPTLEVMQPGLWRVRNVRTGFHHALIDTAAGLVVVDAPAGWVELHQLPPQDLVPGLGTTGLSQRLIDLVREQTGRPLRAVVLTHAHDDHAGGWSAFAAAGASVFAPEGARRFLQSTSDRDLAEAGARIDTIHGVAERRLLDDVERPVELWSIGPNPHVRDMLVVWLPRQKLLFLSDLIAPAAPGDPPPADRLAGGCWFARWATNALPEGSTIYATHGSAPTSLGTLAAWTRHSDCLSEAHLPATASG
jgi:glyoxylase-like metal-dependent hydrolase (beta-lactamase superfamily II)